MEKLKNLITVVLIISMILAYSSYSIQVFAAVSEDEYIILTEEIYENSIKENDNIVAVPYDICIDFSSNITLFSNNEEGTCFHLAYYINGIPYGFEMTHYVREITTPNGNIVRVNEHTSELPDWYIEATSNYASEMGISATKEDESTIYYNCHSYAWYLNDSDNIYWMNDPTMYYSSIDQSYTEVQYPREGDIICYWQTSDSGSHLNVHSGIVVDVLTEGSNALESIVVESKWGPLGRYIHRGDQCPYVPSFGGNANIIKFYRPRTNSLHNLSEDMSPFTLNKTLAYNGDITDKYAMYEFDVTDSMPYLITIDSNVSTNIKFYDSNMNYTNVSGFDIGNGKRGYIYTFDEGINYFRIQNVSGSTDANIVINVYPHNGHRQINAVYEDEDYHSYSCECGEIIHEIHRWREYSLTQVVCKDCRHIKKLPGSGFVPIIKGINPNTEME